jgi:hypothetical protein
MQPIAVYEAVGSIATGCASPKSIGYAMLGLLESVVVCKTVNHRAKKCASASLYAMLSLIQASHCVWWFDEK